MRRRTFVRTSVGLLAAPFLVDCDPVPCVGVCNTDVQHATVSMERFAQAIQTQQCPEWCWAACISMIFGYYNHPLSQAKIVAQTYGAVVCLPAQVTFTIGADLSRSYIDDLGRPFSSHVIAAYDPANNYTNLSNAMIVAELKAGRPLLYCNTQHAMVLYSVTYLGSDNAPNIIGADVVDPWPSNPRTHALTDPELVPDVFGGRMNFLAAVRVG